MTTTHAQDIRTLIEGETIRVGVRIQWGRESIPGSHLDGWYANDITAYTEKGNVVDLFEDERELAVTIGARELP